VFPLEKWPAVECDILCSRIGAGAQTRSASIDSPRSPEMVVGPFCENSVETFDPDPIRHSGVRESGMR
jgi:hypothetical protein